jgi:hypothetical protein
MQLSTWQTPFFSIPAFSWQGGQLVASPALHYNQVLRGHDHLPLLGGIELVYSMEDTTLIRPSKWEVVITLDLLVRHLHVKRVGTGFPSQWLSKRSSRGFWEGRQVETSLPRQRTTYYT